MRVTPRSHHFDDTFLNVEDRDIKSTTTHVKHYDPLLLHLHLVEAVGDGSGGRLIDNSLTVEASNFASIKSCLLLHVVEVGRHGDYRIFDGSAASVLSVLFHFL